MEQADSEAPQTPTRGGRNIDGNSVLHSALDGHVSSLCSRHAIVYLVLILLSCERREFIPGRYTFHITHIKLYKFVLRGKKINIL